LHRRINRQLKPKQGGAMNHASARYFGHGQETGGMGVPEAGADFYAITNVPYGEGV
jgi:hypothetical protein